MVIYILLLHLFLLQMPWLIVVLSYPRHISSDGFQNVSIFLTMGHNLLHLILFAAFIFFFAFFLISDAFLIVVLSYPPEISSE